MSGLLAENRVGLFHFHFHFISLKKRKYNDNPVQPADSRANRGGLRF